jgi:iron complex transport system permease protein
MAAMGGTIEQTAVERRSAPHADTKAVIAQAFHVVRVSLARHMTLLLTLLALLFAAISFFIGPSGLGIGTIAAGLFSDHGMASVIARDIRLPRAALALFVGGALGASGAALQGLFRNPLAEPGVTGVTSSAGLGAVIALYFGFASLSPAILPLCAIAGALCSAAVLYVLSLRGVSVTALILAGVAIASLATALTALALSLAPNAYAMSEMVLWMMGSLKDRTLADLYFAAPLSLTGIALLAVSARGLDALTLGEDAAHSLGVNVGAVRRRVVFGVALATGAATAAAGAVSFVGLVVPHLLRPFYGYEPARLILPSALGGAALVAASDIVVRLIAPDGQLLLGVLTAMLGAPFFLWLILNLRRGQ